MMNPRQYLSWSSMDLFERSPKKWAEVYLYNVPKFSNKGQAFGKKMADGLESGEMTGDPVLDMVMESLPKFKIMDKIFEYKNGLEVEYFDLKEGKPVKVKLPVVKRKAGDIPILIRPDTFKPDGSAFKEYKTGQAPWSKKDVDELGQITFYATGFWLATRKIPKDIELVHVWTEAGVDGKIRATGEIKSHPTERTMVDILNMMVRMSRAWTGQIKLTEDELL